LSVQLDIPMALAQLIFVSRKLVLMVTVFSLVACSSVESNPTWQAMRQLLPAGDVAEKSNFPPPFHYLRAVVDGRTLFLASNSQNIDSTLSDIVWFSAGREVLRLRDGRLVAAVGTQVEWRSVNIPELPSWESLAAMTGEFRWVRQRDVMPGYRFGVRDDLVLMRVAAPKDSQLKDVDAQSLLWFEERVEKSTLNARDFDMPAARYGLKVAAGKATVIYGEQCLAAKLCLTWQRWPVGREAAQ
jgi:hypothetical protein